MSRRRREGSIQRPHGDDYFIAVVTVGYDPQTGRRRRRTKTGRGDDEAAERVLQALLMQVGRVSAAADSMTLGVYLKDVWMPANKRKLRRMTVLGYQGIIDKHIEPHIGHLRLNKITTYAIEAWLWSLDVPSNHTRLHVYRCLRTALRRAVRWQIIERDPTDGVEPPTVEDYQAEVLDLDEANAVLDGFKGHAVEPAVILALAAGLRRSEVAGLDWGHIDLQEGTVRIERGMHQIKGEVYAEPPKTSNSDRLVTLPDWAIDALRPMRGFGPVLSENGARMRPKRISELYKLRMKDLDVKWVPLKNLRHSHATLALELGGELVAVSRRLGHSNVTITDRFYVKPRRSADKAIAKQIDGLRRMS